VDPATAAGSAERGGTKYYFCSQHCLHAFLKNSPAEKKEPHPEAQYTCPMHPEIVRAGPGSCPKCGMALVPMEGAEEDDTELRHMTRRFWISAVLSAPLLLIAM